MDRETVLSNLRERIVAFATSHLSRDLAEDLAQEVLAVLHTKYAQVTELGDLLPLSFQILRFKMHSLRRKLARRGEFTQVSVEEIDLADETANPSVLVERKMMLERLKKCVAQLGERCRQLFQFKLQGRSFPEIQQAMGVESINTIYTWDHRCRQELLKLMGGSWEVGR